jgi:hypothetical protein
MTKVTDLAQIGSFDITSNATFVVTDGQLVVRLPFQTMLPVLRDSILGTDQSLSTTDAVRFQSVTAFLGSFTNVQIRQNLEIGGFVSSDNTDGDIYLTNELNTPRNTTILMRGYKGSYISTGSLHPVLLGEVANGTAQFPSSVANNDLLLSVAAGGHTGRNFTDVRNKFTGRLTFYATEAWTDTISSSTNVGTGFYLSTHPNGVILDRSQDFQHIHLLQNWDTESGYSTPNITLGSGIQGYKDLIKSDGSILTHEGSTKFKFLNTRLTIDGVVPEDTSPDNNTLLGSNTITFISSRRSAANARRNVVVANDTIGKIDFRGMNQNTASITNTGLSAGEIKFLALETFSATTAGSRIIISTVNSGTNSASNRLNLTNRENVYASDKHRFTDSQGNLIGVISTGTDTTLLSSRQILSTASISLVGGNTATTVLNGFKSYLLSKIETSQASWIRIYSDVPSQSADYYRSIVDDPPIGINLITEVVTTSGNLTQVIAPGIFGFNNDSPVSNMLYITITNNTSTVAQITATLTLLKVEL